MLFANYILLLLFTINTKHINMKKTILLSLLFFAGVLFISAQTQRMVLYEGFSNASCGPCAAQNPTTNALIAANPTKVVAMKYQTNWPGVDPMNAQTQTWVGPRVTYYGITGVPATRVDGGGTSINQTIIDNRYAIPSPFYLTVSHSLNSTLDSAFVDVVVTAAQDFTGTNLVLQVAMIEKHISFANPAGSNGEKEFYNVMRRMLPNSSGTTLQGTWINNESMTFNFEMAIPNYIYDFNQLAFIAFIQSNGDKAIHQAAKNNPVPISLYPKIISHAIPSEPLCVQVVNPSVTIKNDGTTPITSLDFLYGVVGQTPLSWQWTGNIAAGQQTVVNLPTVNFTSTSPVIFVELQDANNTMVYPGTHKRVQQQITYISNFSAVPVTQGFTSTSFPPANWAVVSDDNIKWERHTVGGFGGTPGGSARIRFYDIPQGSVDILYMEGLNLTTSSSLQLTFSLANAMFSASYIDNLRVELSTNCGDSWVTLYNKSGSQLATVTPFVTTSFVPTAAQWRKEVIDLSGYSSQSEVLIRFKATSGYGNNLYIDDINISDPTSIEEHISNDFFNVYPNPVDGMLNIDFLLAKTTDVTVSVFDNTGRKLNILSLGKLAQGNHSTSIEVSSWAAGIYHVVITTPDGVISRKITKF
jgi:hypothetical protein